jgi:perosamine synthetase
MLRGQGQSFEKRYWHLEIGHNYRMTNVQAAILCAQLERAKPILEEKRRVARQYLKKFVQDDRISIQKVLEGHTHGHWIIAAKTPLQAPVLAAKLKEKNIDTRPMFYPINDMPPYLTDEPMPVARDLSEHSLMLPSSPLLSDEQIEFICDTITGILDAA